MTKEKEIVFKYIDPTLKDVETAEECPFCGGWIIMTHKDEAGYHVGCTTEGCMGNHNVTAGFKTEEEAIRAWNRRKGVLKSEDEDKID